MPALGHAGAGCQWGGLRLSSRAMPETAVEVPRRRLVGAGDGDGVTVIQVQVSIMMVVPCPGPLGGLGAAGAACLTGSDWDLYDPES